MIHFNPTLRLTTYLSRRRAKLFKLGLALILVPLLLLITSIYPSTATEAKHYTDLSFSSLSEVKIPDYERYQLDNGLTVFLLENHELPLVSGTAMIRTGERLEPAEQVGLADMVGEVMRSGGTQNHPADQLNQLLEQRAASVEMGVSKTSGQASFNALSEDLELVFNLFVDTLRNPQFPQDKIGLAKTQRKGSIARRNDDPGDISSREFKKLIYGAESPYARTQEYSTLANINRDALLGFYQQYFQPNRIILGIVGDFNPKSMRAMIQTQLGDWPTGPEVPPAEIPKAVEMEKGGVFLVDQPHLNQSTVQMGHLGIRLDNPDVFALYVINEALNSFGGRLFDEVRSRRGLAYSVYGLTRPQYDYPGLFIAGGQTRAATTVPFVEAVQSELEKMRTGLLTPEELSRAQDSILNSFVFNFAQPAQVLSRLMRYDYFGYPDDFIFRYQRAVKNMTAQTVQQVARTHLRPDDMVTLVVGNAAAIQPSLETLATPVTPVDITIAPPVEESKTTDSALIN